MSRNNHGRNHGEPSQRKVPVICEHLRPANYLSACLLCVHYGHFYAEKNVDGALLQVNTSRSATIVDSFNDGAVPHRQPRPAVGLRTDAPLAKPTAAPGHALDFNIAQFVHSPEYDPTVLAHTGPFLDNGSPYSDIA